MFNPLESNGEFIEIFNLSPTDSVNLLSYKIKYQTSKEDNILTVDSTFFLIPPKSFAVIFEGDYDFENGNYLSLIPAGSIIFKIEDNAFGSSGMANSSDRTLYLISSSGDTVDTYTYTADNNKGISDEKIIENNINTDDNWKNSRVLNGTPGFKNSVTPLGFNLSLKTLSFLPDSPLEGDEVKLKLTVFNLGTETAGNFEVEIYEDANADSVPSPYEFISAKNFTTLGSGDSISLIINLGYLNSGTHFFISKILYDPDEDTSDNFNYTDVTVASKPYDYLDAVINEIMYAPRGDEPEWFEIFNDSGKVINLKNWSVSDNSSSALLTNRDLFLSADSFVVVSKDSVILDYYNISSPLIITSFPYLNNGGDAVVIKDSLGVLIDSVYYNPAWGGVNGTSLERIDPLLPSNDSANWASAETDNNATPGKVNSVSRKDYDIEISALKISPQNFKIGQNVSVSLIVKNIGKKTADFIIAAGVDNDLDSLADENLYTGNILHLPSGDSLNLNNLFMIKNIKKPVGILLKAVSDKDQDTTNNSLYRIVRPGYNKLSLIINEIMYDPAGGEPEWIELYNRSSDEINIEGMIISDALAAPTPAVIHSIKTIQPGSYFILARDSSISDYHRNIPADILVFDLPVLNNDEDAVILKDASGSIIDSVHYFNGWGGETGHSLERISFDAPSDSQSSWGPSNDIELSTPGRPNSIRIKEHDLALSRIDAVPAHPFRNETTFIQAIVKNNGYLSADEFTVKFYSEEKGIKKILSEEKIPGLNSGDSVLIRSSSSFIMPDDSVSISADIDSPEDEDLNNNSLSKIIKSGYKKGSVLVNEMMIDPFPGMPEWIELINNSGGEVNLKSWSVSDILPSASLKVLTEKNVILSPDDYLIIADDSSFFNYYDDVKSKVIIKNFPSLGNSNDGIVVYDFNGTVTDSLLYSKDWDITRGRSLERISLSRPSADSTNWLPSVNNSGGTPGEVNSVISVKDYSKHDVIINEIMADPGENNCEFVELLNISDNQVDLGGWRIFDEKGSYFYVSESSLNISPGDYFLIAADSLMFNRYTIPENKGENILNKSDLGLSNQSGMLILKDLKGNTIDSLYYSESWHNKNYISTKNISLEKINPYLDSNIPSNWSSSADPSGATPDRKNSIYSVNTDTRSKISVSPNPFSPDNDGFEDYTVINYSLPQTTAQVMIKIYDSIGRLVRTLANNQPSGSHGSVVFDGLDDSGRPLRIGIYIIYMEAINETLGTLESMKTVVVVARKL